MADSSFIYNRLSNTPQKYRFQLFNPDTNELLTLRSAPIEWKEGIIEVKRDIHIGGVFTSFTVSSLTFIKDGFEFLNRIWSEKEINGQCELIVSWFKTSTRNYVEMPTRFGLNFATCKPRVKVGKFAVGFLIEAQKSSILVKLENRKDKTVDLTKLNSLGGFPIADYTALKKEIVIPALNKRFSTTWISSYSPEYSFPITNDKNRNIYTQFQMRFSANEYDAAVEVPYLTGITNKNSIAKCINNTIEAGLYNFYYDVQITVTNGKDFAGEVYAAIIEVMQGDAIVETHRVLDCGSKKGIFTAAGVLALTFAAGQSLRCYIQTDDVSNIDAFIHHSYFELYQIVALTGEKTIESFPIYESFERILQHVTDTQFPFYSELFGRTDTIYNQAANVYSSENQLQFASIMSGLSLRGATLFDANNPLSLSFEKLFNSLNAIYNLGYTEEIISGFNRIRIERYSDFFEDTEVLDISDRISSYDIESEAMPELFYSLIKSGFNDYTYENINGRGEYNTETRRTTVLNSAAEYEIKSDLRGDTMGIVEKLLMPLTNEDTEEDNQLFIIKTQRLDDNWTVEKQENIQVLENSSLFGDDSLNLYFSPLRMILRHGNRIKGTLTKAYDSYIRFQTQNKKQDLKTVGEGLTLTENMDYLVNDLAAGLYKPVKHTVTTPFSYSDFEAIMANKKGYITFSPTIKGYLLSLKKRNDDDKATIEIIEKI